ncbi:MAG TPA: serine hydrolase domain-containing protein [Candidatus Tumulicola sp.]|nr:serine hydrolase domain-containing protein [Candidatus Tumulicola sp.]
MFYLAGRRIGCVAAAAVVALALAPAARAQTVPVRTKLRAALQRDLTQYLQDRGAAEHLSSLSLSVSLAKGDAPIDVTAGTTRFGGGAPVTPASLYQIGSNTKAFTAVAVLQLEAQGRLSIDAPISRYLPQYPAYGKLTLRQLLNMTGGIPTYDDSPAWYAMYLRDPKADVSADRLIRLVYPKFQSRPGTKYAYSNTGYLLAQKVVDARSASHSFSAEMARIIRSAGLQHTYYTSNLYPAAIARRVVAGYYENADPGFESLMGKDVSQDSLSWAQGAGSIVSTPEDLTVWARALYQGTALLPPKQKAELLSLISTKTAKPIPRTSSTDPAGFGLGVAQRHTASFGTFWFYQGETLGFRAAHLYFPSSGLVVAIFANSRPVEKDSHLSTLFEKVYATIQAAQQ